MKLRSNLNLMVAGALAPVVVLAVVVAFLLVLHERETMEQEAIGRTRSAMSAVDSEVRGHLDTLRALGASRALEAGDLRTFYEETRRIMRTQPEWLNVALASADGRQLFDAVLPFGGEGAVSGDPATYQAAVSSGQPVIGNIDSTPALPQPSVRLRMPVKYGDRVRYVITVAVKPESFSDVLGAQQIPAGWVIALADRNRRFVARLPPMPVGSPVSDTFRAAIERSPDGWFAGQTLEGTKTYTPYITSALSGWVLGIAIPARAVDAGANRTFVAMTVGVAAALAVALFLGWSMARRIAAPISLLAAAAVAIGRGERKEYPDRTPIEELDSLAAALRQQVRLMLERQDLIEREKEALQESDRAKDEFLAMLSHELRNPLAALTAAAHVVKLARPESEAAIKARAVIERQTKHMARLIGDLLDVSRVAMGKVALERERLDLNETVRRVLNVWRASGRLERHELVLDAHTVWVHADRARIEQIVSNLLDNSIKFTPAGRRISVSVAKEGESAVLRVADEGEGLVPGSAERMFGLFVQGERGLDRAAGGLGVGLALVKRLTELHGGTVTGASAGVGRGSTFTVKLPAVEAPAQPAAAPEAPTRMAPRRVLIVEDNDDTRQMLHEALAFSGHEVCEARDGASALAAAAESRPDVALIDIGLPDVDGYEVARRLRAAPGGRRMGLIALTGYGQAEDQRRAFDAGFDAHLTKPVAPERLKKVMAGLGA